MSKWPMRGHFRYLRFKTFPMTPRTPQCEVFCPLLSSSEHSRVPEDSKPPTFPSVGLHPHTWPKWGCDIWGPASISSIRGKQYFVTFIDDHSRKVWIYFLRHKSDVFEAFKKWKAMVENETGLKIKKLRSDTGGEYEDNEFKKFCY